MHFNGDAILSPRRLTDMGNSKMTTSDMIAEIRDANLSYLMLAQQMIRADRWTELSTLVGDDLLNELIPSGTYDDLPGLLLERYAGLASGLVLTPPADPAADDF